MKKFFLGFVTLIIAAICCFVMYGCNYDIIDTAYTFKYAIVQRADGEQIIKIKKWRDYEDGEQIQVTDEDGDIWLLSSFNTILCTKVK